MIYVVYILGFACLLFAVWVMERARRYRAPALHIWLVATSYVSLIVLAMNLADTTGQRIWAASSFVLGIGSLLTMIRYYSGGNVREG